MVANTVTNTVANMLAEIGLKGYIIMQSNHAKYNIW